MAKFNDERGIIYDRVRKQRQNLLKVNVLKSRLRETTHYGINIFAIRNAFLSTYVVARHRRERT